MADQSRSRAFALAALVVPAQAGAVTFPDGVASGDVTSTRAILWTRVDVADNIKVEGWTNAEIPRRYAAFVEVVVNRIAPDAR